MNLKDVKTLSEVSKEKGISVRQLNRILDRLIADGKLIKYKDYRKLGEGKQPYILSKEGIEKIIGGGK